MRITNQTGFEWFFRSDFLNFHAMSLSPFSIHFRDRKITTIKPISGNVNVFNSGDGSAILNSGDTRSGCWGFGI
ncbi:MAG: hypothetical protein LCH54_14765 [Bacteroidetes bacterium]|nr:hypothetical protein [Bacteroidota bacterium]